MSSPESHFARVRQAEAQALSTRTAPFLPPPRVHLFAQQAPRHSPAPRGQGQSLLCKPAHFLRQLRSIHTQQKHICCLFPLVFICCPTEDTVPRLSHGRESFAPPANLTTSGLCLQLPSCKWMCYRITKSWNFSLSHPLLHVVLPLNSRAAERNTNTLSAATSVPGGLGSTSYIKAALCTSCSQHHKGD